MEEETVELLASENNTIFCTTKMETMFASIYADDENVEKLVNWIFQYANYPGLISDYWAVEMRLNYLNEKIYGLLKVFVGVLERSEDTPETCLVMLFKIQFYDVLQMFVKISDNLQLLKQMNDVLNGMQSSNFVDVIKKEFYGNLLGKAIKELEPSSAEATASEDESSL